MTLLIAHNHVSRRTYFAIYRGIVDTSMTFGSQCKQGIAKQADIKRHFHRETHTHRMKCLILTHHELELKK